MRGMIGTPTTPATKPETAPITGASGFSRSAWMCRRMRSRPRRAIDDQHRRQNDEGPVRALLADQPHGEIEPDRQRHDQRPLPAQDPPEVAADRSLPDIGEDGRQRDHGDRLGQRQDERRERDDDGRQAEPDQPFDRSREQEDGEAEDDLVGGHPDRGRPAAHALRSADSRSAHDLMRTGGRVRHERALVASDAIRPAVRRMINATTRRWRRSRRGRR